MKNAIVNRFVQRFFCCLIAGALCLSLVPVAAAAESSLIVQSSQTSLNPGDSFDVTVSVNNADGLAGYLVYIYCDTDVFSAQVDPEDGTYAVKKGTFTSSGTMMANANGEEGYQVLWFSTRDHSGSGSLLTLTLTVDENASGGDYEIGLGYSPENTINVEAERCSFSVEGTSVEVIGPVKEQPDQEPDEKDDKKEQDDEKEALSKTDVLSGGDFLDVPKQNWAYPYVMKLADRGIVSGSGDGCFYPDRQITRAEFVKMLAGIAGADVSGAFTNQFSDVTSAKWFMPYVAWASENGIVNGLTATTFGPNSLLTREQMAALVVRLCEKQGVGLAKTLPSVSFADEADISSYAADAIRTVQRAGIISGYPDGTFAPKANTKRSEAAKVLAGILDLLQPTVSNEQP